MMANLRTKNITGCHYWTTDALYPVIQSQINMLEKDLQSKMQIFFLPNEVKL
jgi:L-ascorbate metabolism protein UlaG (beta-lactamase superfamily)